MAKTNDKTIGQGEQVGVVTLVSNFNYGNRLQAFATYQIYRELGFSPCLLELKRRIVPFDDFKLMVKKIIRYEVDDPLALMTAGRQSSFRRFNSLMDRILVKKPDDLFIKGLRYVSVGSDQVWNPLFIIHYEDWFLGDFATSEQKIALSPSIGLDKLDRDQATRLAQSLKSYRCISVRERRGAKLIKECSGRDAEVICDPTLVLPAEEWRAVADGRCTPDEPYVFTYLLGGVGTEAVDVLDKVTDRGRIPVVPLSDRQKPGEPDAGPAEFIDLIDHAVHVVTDSFHAAVFSSILLTPLTIVHRDGVSMFSRLEQLSEMLGIEEKVYGSPTYDLSRAGEFNGVPEAIEREREKFMTYLEGCLDG